MRASSASRLCEGGIGAGLVSDRRNLEASIERQPERRPRHDIVMQTPGFAMIRGFASR